MSFAGIATRATCRAFPTVARMVEVLSMYEAARTIGHLGVEAAEILVGKFGFLLRESSQRIGRAASQVLIKVISQRSPSVWGPALEHSLRFYKALFRNMLPGMDIPLYRDTRKPVILYTDASFRYVGSRPLARIAFFLYDPHLKVCVYGSMVLPEWFYSYFAKDKKTYIMQAELVAAVCAYFSCPHILRGRPVWHFIDNTGALSCLIHGYANHEDCAHLVNSFHMQLLGIQSLCYFEFVKSEANIADGPTREDKMHLIPSAAIRIPIHRAPWRVRLVGPVGGLGRKVTFS